MKKKDILLGGITQNPILVLALGMCPTMAQTTTLSSAFWLGVATTAVLLFSNLFISLLRNIIPDQVRIPCYIVIISVFVTIVKLCVEKFLPDVYVNIAASIMLIAVNCIILGRAEAFASKNNPLDSLLDGVSMGLGFIAVVSLIGITRELLVKAGIGMFATIAGGFLVLGIIMGLFNVINKFVKDLLAKKQPVLAVAKEE